MNKNLELLHILILTIALLFTPDCLQVSAQRIQLNFTAGGQAESIDSIIAFNLDTEERITFPGSEPFYLLTPVSAKNHLQQNDHAFVYPNPTTGWSTLDYVHFNRGEVKVGLFTATGQQLVSWNNHLPAGKYQFNLSFGESGAYVVQIKSQNIRISIPIMNTVGITTNPSITQVSCESYPAGVKSAQTYYYMNYQYGQVMHFICHSGSIETTLVDAPEFSKSYAVKFHSCQDLNGNEYGSVRIGDQLWMAENLRYLPWINRPEETSETDLRYFVYEFSNGSLEDAKKFLYYEQYGTLYNWPAAQSSCPEGWSLPDDYDWQTLELFLGMNPHEADSMALQRSSGDVSNQLRSAVGWTQNQHGSNTSAFNARPGGKHTAADGFHDRLSAAVYWTATPAFTTTSLEEGIYRSLSIAGVDRLKSGKESGKSVRCWRYIGELPFVKTLHPIHLTGTTAVGRGEILNSGEDEQLVSGICWSVSENPGLSDFYSITTDEGTEYSCMMTNLEPNTRYYVRAFSSNIHGTSYGRQISFFTVDGSFVDPRDDKTYGYVVIGEQTWMTENLGYLSFVYNLESDWIREPRIYVYGYHGFNPAEARQTKQYQLYGALYNGLIAPDVCPPGWHLPSDEEWKILEKELGMEEYQLDWKGRRHSGNIGEQLKASWGFNQPGSNSSRFGAIAGGAVAFGGFIEMGISAPFWTATPGTVEYSLIDRVLTGEKGIVRAQMDDPKGFAIRCIKDS